MTTILICSHRILEEDLRPTCLWREGVVRHRAARADEAKSLAQSLRPRLVVVDRDLPGALELVAGLRREATTRRLSLAVVVRGEFTPLEVSLLEAGANAILRFPAGPAWDDRLTRLIEVPARRDGRFAVAFDVVAYAGVDGGSGRAVAVNLSVNGILLECPFPLATGDELGLNFVLPDGFKVDAKGVVVREAKAGQFGIEFRTLAPETQDRVRRFVESLAS
jgi:hypothetical protein